MACRAAEKFLVQLQVGKDDESVVLILNHCTRLVKQGLDESLCNLGISMNLSLARAIEDRTADAETSYTQFLAMCIRDRHGL